jgi:mono/diheme cytochrome c family protein
MKHSRKIQLLVLVLLVGVVIAGMSWFALRPSGPMDFAGGTRVVLTAYRGSDPTGAPPGILGAEVVARGEYLARAADCIGCHTAPRGNPFAGGVAFKLPFGTLYSTNISPDKETGIGEWTDDEFVKAMHEGVGKNGKLLYPAFPYTAYTLLTRNDVLAIKAYLFSLTPVHKPSPENDMWFPFNQRYLMWFWNVLYNPGQRFEPNIDQTPTWNRGAYLVEALGHCGECHTPRTLLQGLDAGKKFGGTMIEGWKAYNITSDTQSGIGAWSDDELAEYLSRGHAEGRSTAAGPMSLALNNSLRFLAQDDIRAMVAYLRTVPPIHDKADLAVAQTPSPTTTSTARTQSPHGPAGNEEGLGRRVFEGACASCHHWDGSGVQSPYAALFGNRAVNDPAAVNLTQVTLHGSSLQSQQGEIFMPAFGKGYSDAEIAAVVNYVTGRFGARASTITPDQVAKRREEK